MITLEIVQKIWSLLQRPSSPFSQVEARELDNIKLVYGSPIITIDANGLRHLLLPAPHTLQLKQDTQSSGIHILVNEWKDSNGLNRYVDIVCLKPHLNHLFDMILLDILQLVPDHPDQPDRACLIVLDRWRELLMGEKGKLPDSATLLGIWGELKLLLRLTAFNKKVINAWLGPSGGRYDFFISTAALEVKSSMQRKGQTVTIHGCDQLEQPENGRLFLYLIKVEEAPTQGENISDLVDQLLAAGCNRFKLMQALGSLGLSSDVLQQCDDLRFYLTEWRLYPVDNYFPKITKSSFENGHLPNGVIDIVYKIDLSMQPPYPLKDDEAEQVLKQFAVGVK